MPAKPWIESPEVSADDLVRMAEDRLRYPDGSPIYANFTVGVDAAQPGSDRTMFFTFKGPDPVADDLRRQREAAYYRAKDFLNKTTESRPMKDITPIATVRRVPNTQGKA